MNFKRSGKACGGRENGLVEILLRRQFQASVLIKDNA
jgi:hypothetical protein